MKKELPFVWQEEHQKAFQNLKQVITEVQVLAYYDSEKVNLIQSDASLKGFGCVLIQDGRPECYASPSLTENESLYSNIDRERLADCWWLEKFSHYVFGKKVVIETDHKPLESIWKKTITSASPCLQRLLLSMAKYDIDIRYIQGKTNVLATPSLGSVTWNFPQSKTKCPWLKLIQLQALHVPVMPHWKKYNSVPQSCHTGRNTTVYRPRRCTCPPKGCCAPWLARVPHWIPPRLERVLEF